LSNCCCAIAKALNGFYVPLMRLATPAAANIGVAAFGIVKLVVIVVLLRLMAALRLPFVARVLLTPFLLLGCFDLLTILAVNRYATRALENAGLQVGFLGVKDDEVVAHLSRERCNTCGYDLTGNVSGVCPECGAPRQAWPDAPPAAPGA
jgi:hypothetical protein